MNVGVKSRLTNAGVLYRVNTEPSTEPFMNSRNAARDTPPCWASTVTSASDCVTTPSKMLCASLTSRATSPLADVGRPTADGAAAVLDGSPYGVVGAGDRDRQLAGPDHLGIAAHRRGQQRRAAPAASARTRSEVSAETVLESTR